MTFWAGAGTGNWDRGMEWVGVRIEIYIDMNFMLLATGKLSGTVIARAFS